jgi:Protein of unknown function (DUF3828)
MATGFAMKNALSALVAGMLLGVLPLSAATRIDDPVSFVAGVYRHFIEVQSKDSPYTPPEDIYTPRLAKLFQDDQKRAKGEVGCLDFDFWVNAQDWTIKNLSVTKGTSGVDRETVIARFVNLGEREEIHFDFLRVDGRWLLDEVQSTTNPRWTLSKILKCAP